LTTLLSKADWSGRGRAWDEWDEFSCLETSATSLCESNNTAERPLSLLFEVIGRSALYDALLLRIVLLVEPCDDTLSGVKWSLFLENESKPTLGDSHKLRGDSLPLMSTCIVAGTNRSFVVTDGEAAFAA
jgi:hypothetical protein